MCSSDLIREYLFWLHGIAICKHVFDLIAYHFRWEYKRVWVIIRGDIFVLVQNHFCSVYFYARLMTDYKPIKKLKKTIEHINYVVYFAKALITWCWLSFAINNWWLPVSQKIKKNKKKIWWLPKATKSSKINFLLFVGSFT